MCICQSSGKSCHCASGKCSCGPKCSCPNGCKGEKSTGNQPHGGHQRPHDKNHKNNHNK